MPSCLSLSFLFCCKHHEPSHVEARAAGECCQSKKKNCGNYGYCPHACLKGGICSCCSVQETVDTIGHRIVGDNTWWRVFWGNQAAVDRRGPIWHPKGTVLGVQGQLVPCSGPDIHAAIFPQKKKNMPIACWNGCSWWSWVVPSLTQAWLQLPNCTWFRRWWMGWLLLVSRRKEWAGSSFGGFRTSNGNCRIHGNMRTFPPREESCKNFKAVGIIIMIVVTIDSLCHWLLFGFSCFDTITIQVLGPLKQVVLLD